MVGPSRKGLRAKNDAGGDQGNPQPALVVQKKDFVDRVIAATGAKRSDARPIIDATLEQLGAELALGHTLAVPPLGRARVNLEKDQRGGDVITLRLRRKATATTGPGCPDES